VRGNEDLIKSFVFFCNPDAGNPSRDQPWRSSMKPGDLIYPKKVHRDLPKDIHLGIFTGQHDEHGRKIIMWVNGRVLCLEDWEENYYEVIG
jgi:hypothetical protein